MPGSNFCQLKTLTGAVWTSNKVKVITWPNMGQNASVTVFVTVTFLKIWGWKVRVTRWSNIGKHEVLESNAHYKGVVWKPCVTLAYWVNLQVEASHRCCDIEFYLVLTNVTYKKTMLILGFLFCWVSRSHKMSLCLGYLLDLSWWDLLKLSSPCVFNNF